jgi:hypothetical protein
VCAHLQQAQLSVSLGTPCQRPDSWQTPQTRPESLITHARSRVCAYAIIAVTGLDIKRLTCRLRVDDIAICVELTTRPHVTCTPVSSNKSEYFAVRARFSSSSSSTSASASSSSFSLTFALSSALRALRRLLLSSRRLASSSTTRSHDYATQSHHHKHTPSSVVSSSSASSIS